MLDAQEKASAVVEKVKGAVEALAGKLGALAADGEKAMAGLEGSAKDHLAGGVGGGFLQVQEHAKRTHQVVGAAMAGVGTALLGAGLAAGAAVETFTSKAADFQEQMTALVTGAGETKGNLDLVSSGILTLAGKVGISADELAKGMYMIESSGFHGAQGLDVLRAAAEGAKVGGADMAVVAKATTSALHDYALGGEHATEVTSQLVATVASGKMHMDDLAGSLGQILPTAAAAHVSLAEVGAALATMTAGGTPAADAATYLRQTILQLENPSTKASETMQLLGTSAGEVANTLTHNGLIATFELLEDHLSHTFPAGSAAATAALANMVGGTKSMQAALELTGPGMQTWVANAQAIGEAAQKSGQDVQGWADVQEDANQRMSEAKASIDAAEISIGNALLPALASLLDQLLPVVQSITQWIEQNPRLVATILEVVSIAGVLVGLVTALAGVMFVLDAASLPVIAVLAALAAAAAALYMAWSSDFLGIREVVGTVVADVTSEFGAVTTGLSQLWTNFTTALSGILQTVESIGQSIYEALSYLNPFAEHSPSLVAQVSDGVQAILTSYEQAGRIRGPLGDAGAAVQDFAGQSTDALRGLAQTSKASFDALKSNLQDTVNATKDRLQELKDALAAAKSDLQNFEQTPIQGTKAFEDQKFALQQQEEAIQLQMDQMKLGGASANQLKPLQDQLDQLRTKAEMVDLQEHLKLDPLKKQIQELTNTHPELPFDQIVAGIKKAQANIATLEPAVTRMQAVYDQQSHALSAMTNAAQGAGAAMGGLGKGLAGTQSGMADLKKSLDALATAHAAAVPPVQHLTSTVAQTVPTTKAAAEATSDHGSAVSGFGATISSIASVAQEGFQRVQAAFGLVGPAVQDAVAAFDGFRADVQAVIDYISPYVQHEIAYIANWWINNHLLMEETSQRIWGSIQAIIQAVLPVIQTVIKDYVTWLEGIWQNDAGTLLFIARTLWDMIATIIDVTIHDIGDNLRIVMDLINGDWGDAWTTFQDEIQTTWDGVVRIVKDGINGVIGELDLLIGAWNAIHLSIPGFSITLPSVNVPGVGTVGGGSLSWAGFSEAVTQIPEIPALAAGGIVTSPTLALIGEAGPEAVVPLSGGGGAGQSITIDVHDNTFLSQGEMDNFLDGMFDRLITRLGLAGVQFAR